MANHTMEATAAIVRDTFREAMARKIFWGLFGISTLMILFFLFIMKIDIVEGATATISLFGQTSNREQDVGKLVKQVQAGISTFLFGFGMFLSVFASAGLVPSMLEPGRIELLLSKPVCRMHLLLGRYLGNILVVGGNVAYLVLGVWTILGIKTNIWTPDFLVAILATVFIFSVLLAVVVLVGVLLESTALAVMISVALMIISPVLAQHEIMMRLLSSEWSRQLWKALYQVLPKVYDIGAMVVGFVMARKVESLMPVWTSAAFGAAVMALAIYVFQKRDF